MPKYNHSRVHLLALRWSVITGSATKGTEYFMNILQTSIFRNGERFSRKRKVVDVYLRRTEILPATHPKYVETFRQAVGRFCIADSPLTDRGSHTEKCACKRHTERNVSARFAQAAESGRGHKWNLLSFPQSTRSNKWKSPDRASEQIKA